MKSYFQKVSHFFTKRSKAAYLLMTLFVLLFGFQNCSGPQFEGFSATVSSVPGADANASRSADPGSSTTPPSTQPAQTPPASTLDPMVRIQQCQALIGTPAIRSVSVNEVAVGSGLAMGSGDAISPKVTVTLESKGITNAQEATTLACPIATSLMVDLVAVSDSAHPLAFVSGVDLNGATVSASPSTVRTMLANAVTIPNNNGPFSAGSMSMDFQVDLMRGGMNMNRLRCVQGTAWFAVVARTEVATKMSDSAPVYVKANISNTCWGESKLSQPNVTLAKLNQLGSHVSIDGSWAVAVAPKEHLSTTVLNAGAAYVFRKNGSGGWDFFQKIMMANAASGDNLSSVVIKGDTLALGSRYRGSQGAVYIFRFNNTSWVQTELLTPPVGQAYQEFGASLALSGSSLAVGASNYSITSDLADDKAGTVYIFDNSSGSFAYIQTLTLGTSGVSKAFGSSLAMDGTSLIVGAPQGVTLESLAPGSAYIYQKINGSFQLMKTILPPAGQSQNGMKFGTSVAILGSKIAVGGPAYTARAGTLNMGMFVFYNDWSSSAPTSVGVEGAEESLLGQALALNANGLFVGSPYRSARQGVVDFYPNANLTASPRSTFRNFGTNSTAQDNFGWSISISGNDIIAGARTKSDPNNASGALYIHAVK